MGARRNARGGVLIVGGGFAGSYVARLLGRRGATIVSPENFMLYTPLLPEAASGTLEPRHAVVPLRLMCPHAELVLGRAGEHDLTTRRVQVQTESELLWLGYEHLVVAVGAVARALPIPGLAEHALAFKTIADAAFLRNHVLRRLEAASAASSPAHRRRELTFVFVGAGYAGVEALAELSDLVRDALRRYPEIRDEPQHWVLVDAAEKILPEIPTRLGDYAARKLAARGVDIRVGTTLAELGPGSARLSDGETLLTRTVVWTAGVRANALASNLGLPVDEQGRIRVDSSLRVEGFDHLWSLGDCAHVPNEATPGHPDPPTSQHALRQARRLARNLAREERTAYRYRMLGQVATLGRYKGIADVMGLLLSGFPGWFVTRTYHLYQLPLFSRKLRVVVDWTVALFFRRDIAELGMLGHPSHPGETAGGSSAPPKNSDLERASTFESSLRELAADRTTPFDLGLEHVTPSLPSMWDLNFLRIDRAEGLEATDLAELADTLQGDAGVRHRRLSIPSEEEGARLATGFRTLGWDVTRYLVMVHRGRAPVPSVDAPVEQVDAGRLAGLRTVISRESPGTPSGEVVREIVAGARRVAEAGNARHFAVLVEGEVVAAADLFSDGRTAQIEDVATLPEHRRRGYGRAVTERALAEAIAEGHEFVFLVADDDDWPKELYRRLGFEPVGCTYAFTRASPAQP